MPDPVEELQHPHEAKEHFLQYLRNELKLNFYRAHMLYFIICIAISSVIIYGDGVANGRPGARLSYIDALFLCCSAMTTTGLNPVNLGFLSGFQQAVLCILLIIGNVVFVSFFIVLIRMYFFRKKLADIVQHSKAARKAVEDLEYQENLSQQSNLRRRNPGEGSETGKAKQKQPTGDASYQTKGLRSRRRSYYHQTGFGFFPAPWETQAARGFLGRLFARVSDRLQPEHHHYLTFKPQLDHRGRPHSLNEHQRFELGGVEYRALKTLLYILIGYQIAWIAIGVVFLVPYAYRESVKNTLHSSQPGNLDPGWWAFFNIITEFANGGLNLSNSNLTPFQSYYYILIVSGTVALAGQTQFPIFLRMTIWALEKTCPVRSQLRHTLAFLLHHPRRCFIYLFPRKETYYLLAIQLSIDLSAWVLFEILNIGMPQVEAISPGTRTIDGLFQATGLRTSGAYIINISSLAPALLVVYLVIMYISSFPIVMALRKTNTYEERSIGLDENNSSSGGLAQHLRRQLAYDMWFQLLAWFLICIVERGKLNSSAPGFSNFNILFEVTSAYGTVGLSTGVPYDQYSLSGAFRTGSKVILLFVMVRGRHRGLPLAVDRSILLPGEELMHRMDKEYNEKGRIDPAEEEELEEDIKQSGQKRTAGGQGLEEQDPEDRRGSSSSSNRDRNGRGVGA